MLDPDRRCAVLAALLSAIVAASVHTANAAEGPLHYVNGRFGFSVDIPAGFVAQELPENGDASSFERDGTVITVSAVRNENSDTMASFAALSNAACLHQRPSYLDLHANWAVLSCPMPDGRLLYQRSALRGPAGDAVFTTVRMTYPAQARDRWDRVAVAVSQSMKPAPGG